MDIEGIKSKIRSGHYTISFSHTDRIRLRGITLTEIEKAVLNGSIIEPYPDDPRGPSCLVFGFSDDGRPLHVVCGNLSEYEFLIITVYEPDMEEWEPDFITRRGAHQDGG